MSDFGELNGQLQPVHDDPATDRKATLNTVWRCHQLGFQPEETAEILAELGLVGYESGGRYDPTGRRYRRGQKSPQIAVAASEPAARGILRADADCPPAPTTGPGKGLRGARGGAA